jgi:hypothetical protein
MKLSPKAIGALKALACVAFSTHMAATCAQNLPEQSVLGAAAQPFRHYHEVVGSWQAWDMFTTIPYYHAYRIDLQVTEGGGARDVGVLLPGLRGYDGVVRTETLFTRMLYDASFSPYLEAYFGAVCHELRAREGHGGQTLVLRESCERLRWLSEIQRDGTLSTHEVHPSRAFQCD